MVDASEIRIFSHWKIHDPRKRSSDEGKFYALPLPTFGSIYAGKRISHIWMTGTRVTYVLAT